MSTHLTTHPWIDFEVNLSKGASAATWRLLGEAVSKCEHLAGVPLMPDVAKQLHHIFLAKGVHATAAIEGNTLTEAQVLSLVKSEQPEGAATSYAIQEVNNILEAANTILADIEREGSIPITPDLIKRYNKTVLSNLETEEHVVPGEISKVQVGVPNYIGCPPELCERLLQQYCEWLNGETFTSHDGNPADEILVGLIKAIFAHLYLVWIHPFGDGNGRTARLLEVQILLEAGVPSPAAHLLSDFYNRDRTVYVRKLDAASKSKDGMYGFVHYALEGFVSEIREQIKVIKLQQWKVHWINYVYSQFEQEHGAKSKRQRALVLEITELKRPVDRSEIRKLSGDIALLYADKAARTIDRDLAELVRMSLLRKDKNQYMIASETVLQFLPRGKAGSIEAQLETAKSLRESAASEQLQLDLSF